MCLLDYESIGLSGRLVQCRAGTDSEGREKDKVRSPPLAPLLQGKIMERKKLQKSQKVTK